MKTTLKKTINDFNESYVPDDKDVFDSSEIDIEKITRNIRLRIAAEKKPSRKKKGLPIMLAAAVAATAIVGTTVIAANITGKEFNIVIQGESDALEVYDSDRFRFETSNDNLKADFLRMIGDNNIAYAAIELSTKDGSPIVDDGYSLSNQDFQVFGSQEDYEEFRDSDKRSTSLYNQEMSENNQSFFENEPFSSITDPQNYYYCDGEYNPDFYRYWQQNDMSHEGEVIFTNTEKTENSIYTNIYYIPGETPDKRMLYIRLENNDKNNSQTGTTVDYRSNYLMINKLSDVVAEAKMIDDATATPSELVHEYIDNGIDIDSAQIRQYENCGTLYVVFHSDDTDDFPTMWDTSESEKVFKLRKVEEIKRCDLSFNVSFTIDKLTTDNTMNIELNSDNAPNTITGDNKLKISITPFSAEVITDSSENGILFENENDLKKLASSYAEIVLKNGNKYYFDLLGGIDKLYLNDDTNFESVINKRIKLSGEALMYRDSKSPVENDMMEYYHCERNIDKTTIIDPTNISKVIINGDTVYSA